MSEPTRMPFTQATTEHGRTLFVPEVQYEFGPQRDYRWYEALRGCPYSRAVMALGAAGPECLGWVALPDAP